MFSAKYMWLLFRFKLNLKNAENNKKIRSENEACCCINNVFSYVYVYRDVTVTCMIKSC